MNDSDSLAWLGSGRWFVRCAYCDTGGNKFKASRRKGARLYLLDHDWLPEERGWRCPDCVRASQTPIPGAEVMFRELEAELQELSRRLEELDEED